MVAVAAIVVVASAAVAFAFVAWEEDHGVVAGVEVAAVRYAGLVLAAAAFAEAAVQDVDQEWVDLAADLLVVVVEVVVDVVEEGASAGAGEGWDSAAVVVQVQEPSQQL